MSENEEAGIEPESWVTEAEHKMSVLFSQISQNWDYWLLGMLILFYPTGSWLVPSADSGIMHILMAGGLIAFAARRTWPCSRRENLVVLSLLFLLFITFLSWWINGLENADFHLFRRRLIFLFASLGLFWMAWRRPGAGFFWWGVVLGAVTIGLAGLCFFFIEGHFRGNIRTYTEVNPIVFGQFAVVFAASAAASISWFDSLRSWLVLLPLSSVVLSLLAAVGSATRGAWLAVLPVFVMTVWFYRRSLYRHVWKAIAACLFFLLLLNISSGWQILERRVKAACVNWTDYMERSDIHANSVSVRLQMWEAAFAAGRKAPIIGSGKAGYQRTVKDGVASDRYLERLGELHFPHSAYATAFGYNGILGLLALIIVLAAPGWVFWRRFSGETSEKRRSIAFAGLLVVVSFFFFCFTDSPFEQRSTLNFYAIMIFFALTASVPE